jgi:dTDP-L-rhamnose 4-epimerase
LQSRDFISVRDIAYANVLAMEKKAADYEIFNVGAGRQITIKRIGEIIAELNHSNVRPLITGKFRKGDVRHCYADISKIKSKLGFEPKISFEEGMKELMEWSKGQKAIDKSDMATEELKHHGLVE